MHRFVFFPLRLWLILLCAACMSCASRRHAKEDSAGQSPLAMTASVKSANAKPLARLANPSESRVGAVRVIGAAGKFVLIEAPPSLAAALPDGLTLRCRTPEEGGGMQTAVVRVGRERRQQFVVADVIDGQPSVGDTVFYDTNAVAAMPPAAAPSASNGAAMLMRP
jgi:hypothetical protein